MQSSMSGNHGHSGHKHAQLVDTLLACAMACEFCAASCLHEDDVKMMARCIELDRDCADICMLAAEMLTRDSMHAHKLLALCAEICEACAAECEKHAHDHCKACAEACRKCAEACRAHAGK